MGSLRTATSSAWSCALVSLFKPTAAKSVADTFNACWTSGAQTAVVVVLGVLFALCGAGVADGVAGGVVVWAKETCPARIVTAKLAAKPKPSFTDSLQSRNEKVLLIETMKQSDRITMRCGDGGFVCKSRAGAGRGGFGGSAITGLE